MSFRRTQPRRAGPNCAGCDQYVSPDGVHRPHSRHECAAICRQHASGTAEAVLAAIQHGRLGNVAIGGCPHLINPEAYDGLDPNTGEYVRAHDYQGLHGFHGSALGSAVSLRPADSASQVGLSQLGSFFGSGISHTSVAEQEALQFINRHPDYRFADDQTKLAAAQAFAAARAQGPNAALQAAIARARANPASVPLPGSTVASLPGAAVPPPPPPPAAALTHGVEVGHITLRQNPTAWTRVAHFAVSRADIQAAVTAYGLGAVQTLGYILADLLPPSVPMGWRLTIRVFQQPSAGVPTAPASAAQLAVLGGQELVLSSADPTSKRADFNPPLDLTSPIVISAGLEVSANTLTANSAFARISLRVGANI